MEHTLEASELYLPKEAAVERHPVSMGVMARRLLILGACCLAHASEEVADEAAIAEELAFGATGACATRPRASLRALLAPLACLHILSSFAGSG